MGKPSKQEAFLALMQEGWTSLHLDARHTGVVVPPHLKNEAHLVLQYGRDLPIPIPDLMVDEDGISATLSFSRTPHHTVVPWSAVYVIALEDGRGILYQEDIPQDVSIIAGRANADSKAGRLSASRASSSEDAAAEGDLRDGSSDAEFAIDDGDPRVSEIASRATAMSVARPQRALRAVPLEDDETMRDMVGQAEAAPPRRRRRPQLRLVK